MDSSYSEEGRCFTFDSRDTGYGRGECVAIVILKPLSEAIKNNDPIRAVIRNTGVAQDGKTNGIGVPSSQAQERLSRATYAGVGLDPSETAYGGAYGTGTTVRDPIEASAIDRSVQLTIGMVDLPATIDPHAEKSEVVIRAEEDDMVRVRATHPESIKVIC